jgi:hypothetical protein
LCCGRGFCVYLYHFRRVWLIHKSSIPDEVQRKLFCYSVCSRKIFISATRITDILRSMQSHIYICINKQLQERHDEPQWRNTVEKRQQEFVSDLRIMIHHRKDLQDQSLNLIFQRQNAQEHAKYCIILLWCQQLVSK